MSDVHLGGIIHLLLTGVSDYVNHLGHLKTEDFDFAQRHTL